MRWEENFGAILQERGIDINYKVMKDDEENWDTIIEAKKIEDEYYKPIKEFLEEDVEESLHELIRGNVLTATRYFQQRVKHFIKHIAMGANNPMHVKKYTYKVEFQDRGAGHIHGTLWLRMEKIEAMRDSDGNAKFEGLTSAFKKFRNNETLSKEEEKSVAHFIDEFTTVSTHENTVGRKVARMAKEVNTHHHTRVAKNISLHGNLDSLANISLEIA